MAIQQIQQATDPERPKGVLGFLNTLGNIYKENQDRETFNNILEEYQQNINDENAYEKAQLDLMKSSIGPKKRIELQRELNEVQEGIIKKQKAFTDRINAEGKKKQMSAADKEAAIQLQEKRGMPRHEAEAFVSATPSVQAQINRDHQELVSRGLRKPQVEEVVGNPEIQEPTMQSMKLPSGQEVDMNEDWPEIPPPKDMTYSERVKWQNDNQKANNKELLKTQEKKKAYQSNENLINSMTGLNESKYLPKDLSKWLVVDPDTGGVRVIAGLSGQVNKQTQLYAKNLSQFIKGAKEIFGARVTNFDVNTFMNQLPTLVNTEEGRRVILKQMELTNQLEKIHNETLDEALKKYSRSANYADIVALVDKKIAGKEKELIAKIDRVVEASDYLDTMAQNPTKFKDTVLMVDPQGKFKAVKKENVSKAPEGWSKY